MYKFEYSDSGDCWYILDPQGYCIAEVHSEKQANSLLSHLNRG